jgi:uncharacterized membrane protein
MSMLDPISVLSSDLVSELIKGWASLLKSRRDHERETEDWKLLEKEYNEHLRWRFTYTRRVFTQQLFYSWLLTFLVIGLVVSGLVFSFLQLSAAIRLGNLTGLTSEVAVSTAGKLSMSSSIVGALVLVISLVFFNLYLKHVYEIKYTTPPHVSLAETDFRKKIEPQPDPSPQKRALSAQPKENTSGTSDELS